MKLYPVLILIALSMTAMVKTADAQLLVGRLTICTVDYIDGKGKGVLKPAARTKAWADWQINALKVTGRAHTIVRRELASGYPRNEKHFSVWYSNIRARACYTVQEANCFGISTMDPSKICGCQDFNTARRAGCKVYLKR